MKSQSHGNDISAAEVTNISTHGFWLLSAAGETFLSFEEFPWFKDAVVANILNVEEPHLGHYHWPELDVDLSDDIISDPTQFPLKANATYPSVQH